ncbi:TetR/AcrR family transcriptional regulator [Nocardiopsis sp. CNT312]|uniref:TetR/AcrR family transcriptional regulator n=1 Tax=Nocardiopsis sp. CNT312 TaxID=1137268 RepID=UPI00048C62EC|nr:TetR/AcrR family transcriptional regulator [Nocardiopsis sp. CNT312]
MTAPPHSEDRRTALKERHRRAIIDAAAALLHEHGSGRFTADQLAARADVARRTVFNHFPSTSDVLIEVCADRLDTLVTDYLTLTAHTPDHHPTAFDDLAAALRRTDLVPAMAYLTRAMEGTATPAQAPLMPRVFTALSQRLTDAITRQRPHPDPLETQLLVNTVIIGVSTLYSHWAHQTGATDTDHSRALWNALVEQLLTRLRHGFDH